MKNENGKGGELLEVAPGRIGASGTNPRKSFPKEAQEELMESIRTRGVIQPLIVRRRKGGSQSLVTSTATGIEYELVAGERRWRAAVALKLASVPVLVRELSDGEVEEVQVIENLQREGVSALEEAEGYRRMIESGRYTAESLAEKIGKSRSHVFGRLKLCRLSEPVRKAVVEGKLDGTVAGLVAKIPDPKRQAEALKRVLQGYEGTEAMSFRQAKEMIEEEFTQGLGNAPWLGEKGIVEASLVPAAGGCDVCPKRSGNMLESFPEFKGSANVCTDPKCYGEKAAAFYVALAKRCAERGVTFLAPNRTRGWFYGGTPMSHVVAPGEFVPGDKKKRTWMELFAGEKGASSSEYLVCCYDDEGKRGDWILLEKAAARAKELGIGNSVTQRMEPRVSYEEQERQRREKAKPLEAAAVKVLPAVLAAAEKAGPTAALLRLVVPQGWRRKEAMKGAGVKSMEKATVGECMKVLLWTSCLEHPVDYGGSFQEGFEEACQVLKVDLDGALKEARKGEGKAEEKKLTTKKAKGTKTGKKGRGK